MGERLDISLIICTYNRAESLRETLDHLARTNRDGLSVEIIVVDNNSTDQTREVVRSFEDRLPLRYLFEPTPGKSHALNRALEEGRFGEIVAFLDDDMSPHPDWFKGVAAISARWPQHDVFSGKSYVIWPVDNPPSWARRGNMSWLFSVLDLGGNDREIMNEKVPFPTGGSCWIRSRALSNGRRFEHLWLTEPMFLLQLAEAGYKGAYGPDAVTGHRIQPSLLSETVIRTRALQIGRGLPHVRLLYPNAAWQAAYFKKHPFLWRMLCLVNLLRWVLSYLRGFLARSHDDRFVRKTLALVGMANNFETLRSARRIAAERRRREATSPPPRSAPSQ